MAGLVRVCELNMGWVGTTLHMLTYIYQEGVCSFNFKDATTNNKDNIYICTTKNNSNIYKTQTLISFIQN